LATVISTKRNIQTKIINGTIGHDKLIFFMKVSPVEIRTVQSNCHKALL